MSRTTSAVAATAVLVLVASLGLAARSQIALQDDHGVHR
jgi:hypothetical protein